MAAKKKSKPTQPSGRLAVIYARYSSHNQRDVSIDQQVKVNRAFAKEQALTVVEVYADHAISGTTDNRPEFQRMIEDSKRHSFDYVIVYSLDRFARDRYDSVTYKRILKENGVRVLSSMEHITDDPSGILMESVLEGLAEYYSKELSTKIQRGLRDNAEKCMVASSLPYGYKKGPDGKFAIEPKEAEVVREIFHRVLNHELLSDIYNDLNERGLKTKHGANWNRSSFGKLLSNERYIGTYIYSDIRIENGVPPIIDRETFFAVKEEMSHRANPRGVPGKRRGKNVYILTGKIYCGACKSPLIGNSGTSKTGKLHTYYACRGQLIDKTCDKARVRQDKIEYFVAKALQEFALDDELLNQFADSAVNNQEKLNESSKNEIELLQKELKQVESSINNMIKAIEQGLYTEAMKGKMLDLEERKKVLLGEISYKDRSNRLDNLSRDEILAAFNLLRQGEVTNKVFQELLFDMFLRAVYVYDDHVTIVFNYQKNGHSATDIPFNIDEIPEIECSFKRKIWRVEEPMRTSEIVMLYSYVVLTLPFEKTA